jgi:hypothetical protein
MKYRCIITDPPGTRLKEMTVNDQPLDPTKTYSVTTNEFLMIPLQDWYGIQFTDVFVYQDFTEFQALLNYVMEQQVITPSSEGRVELPVELIAFNANVNDKKVNISWQTATEVNNRGFEVQRRTGNNNWQTIGFVNGKGTTTQTQAYTFSDNLDGLISSGKVFYRLKIIGYDGSFEYSTDVFVNLAPDKFELAQNYPNPFNPSTSIHYGLSSKQFVSLKIFNVLGKEIVTLVNEEKEPGRYEVVFDTNDCQLSSGVYFYQIEMGDFVQMKKMILMK